MTELQDAKELRLTIDVGKALARYFDENFNFACYAQAAKILTESGPLQAWKGRENDLMVFEETTYHPDGRETTRVRRGI